MAPTDADPLVSVLMPCRNAGATLAVAAASVRSQVFTDWELIIADDGSRDASPQIAAALAAQDARITALSAPQGNEGGAAAARNRALDAARGRYIAFLDADDLWRPAKLRRQLDAMAAAGDSAFCCSAYAVRSPGRATYIRQVPAQMTRNDLLRGNRIGCLTAIYDTQALGKQPMPQIEMRHDYALWLHLLTLTPAVIGVNEVLADHHHRPGSLSAGGWRASRATWAMLRGEAGLGRIAAARTLALHTAGRLIRG